MVKQMTNDTRIEIDATGLSFKELNMRLQSLVAEGAKNITLKGVCGQRYIGTNIQGPVNLDIYGTPGNDLGAFMNGPVINVYGNAQDGCANTMDDGTLIVHGHGGDIMGLAARGGQIFVRDDVGYRAGIHMKEYGDKKPSLVIGGIAQDFVGEYMAGGVLVLLGLNLAEEETWRAKFIGTGMHGGVIYLRGKVNDYQLGREVGVADLEDSDYDILRGLVRQYCGYFNCDEAAIFNRPFLKLYPRSKRPYGRLYAT